jgi:hypothetical protein
MGKVLSVIIGLVILGLGIAGIIRWQEQVIELLQAVLALMAVIIGLGILVFGLSELRAGEPPSAQPTIPQPSSREENQQ